jgi:hypothetical protein
MVRTFVVAAFAISIGFAALGCSEDTPMEKAGEAMEEAADDMADAAEDFGDDVKDAADDLTD